MVHSVFPDLDLDFEMTAFFDSVVAAVSIHHFHYLFLPKKQIGTIGVKKLQLKMN